MKNTFTIGNSIASVFMIIIGVNLLFIHQKSDFLPKYVTIILGILISIHLNRWNACQNKEFKKRHP
jgi:hypothetical protein